MFLLLAHGGCVGTVRTLLAEAEAVVKCRPLTVETLADPLSYAPITPNHLLTVKSKVVMPSPGEFQKADLYCRKKWKKVQYLLNEFWTRWKKEYLMNLQMRKKWEKSRRNFQVGDIVLLKEDSGRNKWPMRRVIAIFPDQNGFVRNIRVKVSRREVSNIRSCVLDRPISKVVLLLESEE